MLSSERIAMFRCHSCCCQIVKDRSAKFRGSAHGLWRRQLCCVGHKPCVCFELCVPLGCLREGYLRAVRFQSQAAGRKFSEFFVSAFLWWPSVNGDDRDRTGNLRLAKPALSQLSYVPGVLAAVRPARGGPGWVRTADRVGVRGFEPRTSALSELRSNQLSYTPQ